MGSYFYLVDEDDKLKVCAGKADKHEWDSTVRAYDEYREMLEDIDSVDIDKKFSDMTAAELSRLVRLYYIERQIQWSFIFRIALEYNYVNSSHVLKYMHESELNNKKYNKYTCI